MTGRPWLRGRKKPWRLEVKFGGKWGRPIAYATEASARRAARFEESCGASETRIYRKEEDEAWHA